MAVSSRSKDLSGRSWSVEWQPGDLDSPLIFHRRGTRVGDFRKRWKKACGAAGVSGRLLYDLRRTAIGTMALAGTRPGEALALQAGDVDLAGLTVQIERTVDKRGHVGVPKDGERRTVDLHPLLVPALKRVIRERKEDTLKWGQRWDEAAALFTTRTGRPFDLANLAKGSNGPSRPRHLTAKTRRAIPSTISDTRMRRRFWRSGPRLPTWPHRWATPMRRRRSGITPTGSPGREAGMSSCSWPPPLRVVRGGPAR